MKKMFKSPFRGSAAELYQERGEKEEFGRALKDAGLCKRCRAVYYKKSWHHGIDSKSKEALGRRKPWQTMCPACRMVENGQFEGELMITEMPKNKTLRGELLLLIKNYGRKAYRVDSQHRVIGVYKEDDATWRVTTTENQLAKKLANKI